MKNNISGKTTVTINASSDKVWKALTDPAEIKKYFFGTNTKTDWQVGHPIIFEGEWQGKTYRDKGTILDFKPNKLIRYSYWSSMSGMEDKPENYVPVTYELDSHDTTTKLTITQE